MPKTLEPAEPFAIARGDGGALAATWFEAAVASPEARGAVLLVHPWHARGQAYFHRHRRIPALRRAGYHVLTFDVSGVGDSSPALRRFADRDVHDALGALEQRARGLPRHVWGVCMGGYWAHLALAEDHGIGGAVFEDVTHHPLEWSRRHAPWGRPAYAFFEHVLRRSYAFLDLKRQTPYLHARSAAYVSGAWNTTVRPYETRELARLAGGACLIVEDAGHLECARRDPVAVVDLALETFHAAESRRTESH